LCEQGCASSPNDSYQQQMLKSAAEELRSATNVAHSNALKRKLVGRLEVRTTLLIKKGCNFDLLADN
jgi:hypothetical protein